MHSPDPSGAWTAVLCEVVHGRGEPRRLRAIRALEEAAAAARGHGGIQPSPQLAGDAVLCALVPGPAGRALDAAVEVTERLHPVAVTIGFGRGVLVDDAPGGDGDACLRRAREALEAARRRRTWGRARGFGEREDVILDAMLRLMGAVRSRWTDRQNEIVRLAREHTVRKDVAAVLGVSPSVVTEALQAARFDALLEAEAAVRRLLEDVAALR